MHKCTEEDFSEFHEVDKSSQITFELKKNKNMFYCINETDQFNNPVNMTVHGSWNSGMTRALSVNIRPCIPKQRTEWNKEEKCLIDDVNN